MAVGRVLAAVYYIINTTKTSVDSYEYEVEDESVAKIGENGVLTALTPGKTTVKVTAITYGNEGEEIINETKTTIKVSDEKPGWVCYAPYIAVAFVVIVFILIALIRIAKRKK